MHHVTEHPATAVAGQVHGDGRETLLDKTHVNLPAFGGERGGRGELRYRTEWKAE